MDPVPIRNESLPNPVALELCYGRNDPRARRRADIPECPQRVKERPFSSGADWLFLKQRETTMDQLPNIRSCRDPWNKGKLVGLKVPFKLKEIWAIRVRLQLANRQRELALFNLAIDSKLRACDLVKLRVRDVCHGQAMASRTIVLR